MLSIILKILSILGIILLVLLALIVIILLLVLFFPICYRIRADKALADATDITQESDNQPRRQPIHADIKAWWLFGFLRAGYRYPTPGVFRVKLLFFTLYDSSKSSDIDFEEEPESGLDKVNLDQKAPTPVEKTPIEKQSVRKPSGDASSPSANANEDEPSQAQSASTTDKKPNLFEKIQYTIQKIYDKIKSIFFRIKEVWTNITYYKEILSEEDTKELLKHILMRLGKILKSLRPRKLHANIWYGAASPDITGYVCAVYGMISPHLGKHVIFNPDFENEIFGGDINAAGHTTVFLILWNLLMLAKDKRLWELRDKLSRRHVDVP